MPLLGCLYTHEIILSALQDEGHRNHLRPEEPSFSESSTAASVFCLSRPVVVEVLGGVWGKAGGEEELPGPRLHTYRVGVGGFLGGGGKGCR